MISIKRSYAICNMQLQTLFDFILLHDFILYTTKILNVS